MSMWDYTAAAQYTYGTDLTGYKVEATDGHIGKVDEATDEVGAAYIVVNCKPWLIGKHVMVPAGAITRVDHDKETIHVGRTKDQVKDAPEYDPDTMAGSADYRSSLGTYYGDR
ncbi:PRC-barrel domain-containing protein [Streptomyces sp. H10-C2]|uniref:PRC-barrel domain-containing protein n=1 Tax=unclassified Streptomyces TaxID=2593676 RepID=UPI0024B9D9F5|nr:MULTISPECIES: PRC-barrel domain-containing protein [unclassified Streptomyces]MDJ0347489.1 PRC-barrel domain-containing protein [Streptomyces sp. PH10-H1]MDJ0375720.1 PRC-barrel domain-containing protein [Streptomyces sp. H10-C2]